MCFDLFFKTQNNDNFSNKIRLIVYLYSETKDINCLYKDYLKLRDGNLNYNILRFYIEKQNDKIIIDEYFVNYNNLKAALNIINFNLTNLDINKSHCTVMVDEFSGNIFKFKKNIIETKIKIFTRF